MSTRNIFLSCLMAVLPAIANAQEAVVSDKGDDYSFNHLAIGGSIGTTGIGLELSTPINKHLTLRGAVNVFAFGTLKVKLASSMGDVYSLMGVSDQYISEAVNNKKVEVGVNVTSVTGKVLLDYYPVKSSSFHVTGGVILGNRNLAHIFNTEDGNMMFWNIANSYVRDYNEQFNTAYPSVGLKFGDYVFTADENGNLDARMLVNAVRPYLGIGWGRSNDVNHKRKIRTNFDLGFEYWGRPQFKLNNGEKVIETGNKDESGALKFLSGFWAWPTLKITFCGDLF